MRRISYFMLLSLFIFIDCKPKEDPLLLEYRNQAIIDIKVDSVKTFTYGLPFIYPDSAKARKQLIRKNKIDSVYRKYGLIKKNLGCVIGDKKLDKATKEYHKITDIYLNNRNGKNWKEKMEKELDIITEN